MKHRIAKSLGLLAALVGVACLDMSAPKGPAYISLLLLPSPSVVLGDVMRDSNGTPAPLQVIAYGANNAPIVTTPPQFFITDSAHYVHLTSSNQLFGDQIGTAHVVGQVGSLQTAAALVPVTYAPDTMKFAATLADSLNATPGGDSASSISTLPLGVQLTSALDSAAQGFIVKYTITYSPATSASSKSPAVYLADDTGKPASADTTDISGVASPKLTVNTFFLADTALLNGHKFDSVVVVATAKYLGVPIKGSPLRFVVKLTTLFNIH